MRLFVVLCILGLFCAENSYAQGASGGVTSFQQGSDAWRRQQESEKFSILQNFKNDMGLTAIKNVFEAEQVFCYEVAGMPENFDGYTMNNMAVTGFCGVLNKELTDMIVEQIFAVEDNVLFNQSENCVINPKLVLRFVRGVDYTDVLLSSPCHSIAVFYGGSVKPYNFRPSAELIDTIVNSFNKNRVDFVSPALLNQLLPIGVVQNDEQRRIIEKQTVIEPVRNWQQEAPKEEPASTPQGGWNNLAL